MEEVKTTVSKNKTAKVGEKYSYQYVDIAQIHEYLESIDARYYQYIDRIGSDDYIITVPIIGGEEQTPRRGCRVVDATLMGVNNPAQQQGSALTYARRYSLLMAFGLATEDDDAASLSVKKEPTKEDAENYVLTFGKHTGKKLSEVIENDWYRNYLLNGNDEYIKKCIELLTGQKSLTEEEQEEILNLTVELNDLVRDKNYSFEKIHKHYKVESTQEMTLEQLRDAVAKLKGMK
jgi:hypothetical protein